MSYFRSWSPICYHLTYVRGLIFEAKGQFDEARQCYENTLSVNPTHLSSLYHLGRVYYQLGFYRLSEQTLKVKRQILFCEVYAKSDSYYTVSKCCFFAIWLCSLFFYFSCKKDGTSHWAWSWGHLVSVGCCDWGPGLGVLRRARRTKRKHSGQTFIFENQHFKVWTKKLSFIKVFTFLKLILLRD